MELFSLEGKSVLPVLSRCLTEIISCHLLHWSITITITDTEQAHTLLEGAAAIYPREETLIFVLPGHGLHPSPLVLFFPWSTPSVLSYLLLWAFGAFLLHFHILGLSFFCFNLPLGNLFYLSHASGCNFPFWTPHCFLFPFVFQQMLSLCVVLFRFFIIKSESFPCTSLLLWANSCVHSFQWSQTYSKGLFPVFLFDWLFNSLCRSWAQTPCTPSPSFSAVKFPVSSQPLSRMTPCSLWIQFRQLFFFSYLARINSRNKGWGKKCLFISLEGQFLPHLAEAGPDTVHNRTTWKVPFSLRLSDIQGRQNCRIKKISGLEVSGI